MSGDPRAVVLGEGVSDRIALETLAHFERALGDAVYVCDRDLEDELVRALGAVAVARLLRAHGKLSAFRTYRKQPAHRGRPLGDQLHGFLWNWKLLFAAPFVEALDLDRVPRPLDGVLEHVRPA